MRYFFLLSIILFHIPAFSQEYIANAISSEDHKRKRPLLDAMEAGLAGISAEVNLSKDGQLKCGGKTLEDLYIKPLNVLSQQNKGRIYEGRDEEFFLVLTIDADSMTSYRALEKIQGNYPDLFSDYTAGKRNKKAVRLIVSGDIPVYTILNSDKRWCFPDENIRSMNVSYDARFIAMATLNYKKIFDWNGEQNMPNMAYMSFLAFVKNAHKTGRVVRLQNAPENTNAFGIFLEAGVDFIEIKDIPTFVRYWRNR